LALQDSLQKSARDFSRALAFPIRLDDDGY